jgi:hypothetical protein
MNATATYEPKVAETTFEVDVQPVVKTMKAMSKETVGFWDSITKKDVAVTIATTLAVALVCWYGNTLFNLSADVAANSAKLDLLIEMVKDN